MKRNLTILTIILFIFSITAVSASGDVDMPLKDAQEMDLITQTSDDISTDVDDTSDVLSFDKNKDISDDNASDVLSVNNDENNLKDEEDGSIQDLQDLIRNTPSNGVLNLNKSYTFKENDLNSVSISRSITINGNNHLINLNSSYFSITSSGSTIIFNNIEFDPQFSYIFLI